MQFRVYRVMVRGIRFQIFHALHVVFVNEEPCWVPVTRAVLADPHIIGAEASYCPLTIYNTGHTKGSI